MCIVPMKYVIITPAKDEASRIENMIRSVIAQSHLPERWIIVDDGSTDNTSFIVEKYCNQYEWIRLVYNNTTSEERAEGSKIVRAFYAGFAVVSEINYDFVVKLDADLELPGHYFEEVAKTFAGDPLVGLCGGYCMIEKNNIYQNEVESSYHLRGALKAYRAECFNAIGGIKPVLGWDGLDEMSAMHLGWKVKILDIGVKQLRPTRKEYNKFALYFNSGKSHYFRGHSLFLTIVRTITRIVLKPYGIAALVYFSGYLSALLRREKKYVDKDLARFTNKFHLNRLLLRNK